MNLVEKDKFVNDILDGFKRSILEKVDQFPEGWDGHEIRQYIADYFLDHYLDRFALKGKRKSEYNKACQEKHLF